MGYCDQAALLKRLATTPRLGRGPTAGACALSPSPSTLRLRPSVAGLLRRDDPEALAIRALPRLSADQKSLVAEFLWLGAEAYGFRGEVWTCGRVTHVLGEELRVTYHSGHVSRILKDLGCPPQVPIDRAIPLDGEAIEY
jgi:hypothetical protein